MRKKEWLTYRMVTPHTKPRNAMDPLFYSAEQEKWWHGIFQEMSTPLVLQKAIDFNYIKAYHDEFIGIIECCKALDLY